MKRLLTSVLAISLLSSAAVIAQPNNSNRSDQSANRNEQNSNDQKNTKGRGGNRPATAKAAPERTAPTAPNVQASRGPDAPSAPPAAPKARVTRERAAPAAPKIEASRERVVPAAPKVEASRERAAPPAPKVEASRERAAPVAPAARLRGGLTPPAAPRAQASRERAAPPAVNAQDQNRARDLQNNPSFRVAAPRFSRGDRLPDQYRQDNRYYVSDWQQHGLRQPPGGYRWVRDDNNDFFLALIATGMITQVVYRDDRDEMWRQHYSREYTYDDDIYYRDCRSSPDPAGIIAGALIGGLLGNAAGDGRTGATLAGVIVGGAVGAALTNNLDCEDRSYAYKTYYDGFNSGRPGSRYSWRNPGNGHYGNFEIVSYANDPYGFRCANFTQTIYIQGRPELARGRACRQPDGTWAIVG